MNILHHPDITHHQFMLLNGLACMGIACPEGTNGEQLRTFMLNRYSITYEGPAFYQCMARLEAAGFVTGTYAKKPYLENGETRPRRVRAYLLSEKGRKAHDETLEFYKRIARDYTPLPLPGSRSRKNDRRE